MNELKRIYRNAANIIRAKYSTLNGVDKVLRSLEQRLPEEPLDPRVHRELFVEPRIDAQQLGVPLETAETVARQLHKFGLLRLWVRVVCPNAEGGEAGTVLETDNEGDFQSITGRSCDHCGGNHDFDWDSIDTLYAINSSGDESDQTFSFESLKSSIRRVPRTDGINDPYSRLRCDSILENEQRIGSPLSPGRVIALSLSTNHPILDVPPAIQAWWNAWMGPLLMVCLYCLLIIPVARLCGQIIAVVFSVVLLIAIFFAIRGQVQSKLAPTLVQRTAMWGGLSLATLCVMAGSSGCHVDAEAGEGSPWWSQIAFGEVSMPLVYSGIATYSVTLVFVFAFDFQRGWFAREEVTK